MEDTRKIQIAENKFLMLIMGDENRFLKTTYFQYIQYCESLSASFFKGRSTEVQNNILKANFGLTNEDILSWENRASRYQMTPQSFSFFLHVAMYSASHGFNAVYNGVQQRYAERKQIINVVRKHEDKSKKRKAKKNKKKKHQTVDSDSDPLTNDESDDYMRNTVDDDDQIGDDQDVNINRSIADASGSQSHIDQLFDMDVTPVEPVSNLDVTMPQPQLLQQPDNNLSNLTKSSNKKKKSNKNIIQQVITGHKPGDDGSRQTDKSKQNSKNSKKKLQEAKSEKHKKQKKDKSCKTLRSKVLAEILDVLRKLI
ncbi:uncharacterized protein OCT59_012301 [Rhizophagus irregularis]|uniref:uncharacterized protein n=1 Tax=Rhizophagus irregularis TaxID=588596 RepID=UPI003325C680|nr:hypothetical protein OCT59_012301 [Rhizophagus irregularis]